MFYRSTMTGKIVLGSSLYVLNNIYGNGTLDNLIKNGLIKLIKEPTVIDCIRDGSTYVSIARYREIHRCGLKEALESVAQIKRDMNRVSGSKGKVVNGEK